MATYRDALKRLQIIYNECSPAALVKSDAQKDYDDFTKLKKSIHVEVKDIRCLLKEREELLSIKPGSKEAAEASHRIRTKIKSLREDAVKLQAIQKDQSSKKNINDEVKEKNANRAEVIELVFKHIEECEVLEKKRFAEKLVTDRSVLFSGAVSVKLDVIKTAVPDSSLPDIDPDPEVTHDLLQLQQTNVELDRDLDQIQVQVGHLKEIAITMTTELGRQTDMLEELDHKVDKAQDHLDNVNMKMKDMLEKVMKGDKFLINCVLLCVLLGLAGFITSVFLK